MEAEEVVAATEEVVEGAVAEEVGVTSPRHACAKSHVCACAACLLTMPASINAGFLHASAALESACGSVSVCFALGS